MASILCIYGTTSGNTELVVDQVALVLENAGHIIRKQRVEKSKPEDITGHDLYILAASTYGHGILQDYFIPFAAKLKDEDFSGNKFAVIGLGDSKYDREYNIESAVILEDLITGVNGNLICPALKINKSPVPHLQGKVVEWAEALSEIIDGKL